MTHEEYVEMQRAEIINTAKSITEGNIDITEGVRFLYYYWREAELPTDTPEFRGITNIEDDLDHIPKRKEREQYNKEYLQKMDLEENEILNFFKDDIKEICERIIKEFSKYVENKQSNND